jgi:alkaline phosphatase
MKMTLRLIVSVCIIALGFSSCRRSSKKEAVVGFDTYRKVLLVSTVESIHVVNTSRYPLTWKSDNRSVATVNSQGSIRAIAPGTATITATTPNGLSKQCFVAVTVHIPRNIVVFIGDGMGYEQIKAAGIYEHGRSGTLGFESFENKNSMTTSSATSVVTDSAAAATAMATGHKVKNGVVSMAIPGDRRDLPTVVEFMKSRGKSTGLVTNSYLTDATPAGFGAHAVSRSDYLAIAAGYYSRSRPNLLFGGGDHGMSVSSSQAAGYFTVTTKGDFMGLAPGSHPYYCAQFGQAQLPYKYDDKGVYPNLSELTEKAIELLQVDPDGFFLMVEGGRIDHAGHNHDLIRNIYEVIEFEDAVNIAVRWMAGRPDTLVLVTADHETGGLKVLRNNGQGRLPDVSWSTIGHTAARVPVFVHGASENVIFGEFDNTHIANLLEDFYQ